MKRVSILKEKTVDHYEYLGREYIVGDIPDYLREKIKNIKTIFSTDREFLEQWRKIIIEILEIWNTDVNILYIDPKSIQKMIDLLYKKEIGWKE